MGARLLTDPRVLGGVRSSFPVLLQLLAIILRQGVAAFAAKRTPVGDGAAEVKADKGADHAVGLAALCSANSDSIVAISESAKPALFTAYLCSTAHFRTAFCIDW